jgi:hypothetical protein
VAHDPFEGTEFLVIEFDERGARLGVLGNRAYSALNRDDAVDAASKAARAAEGKGLPLHYVVVRITTEAYFPY